MARIINGFRGRTKRVRRGVAFEVVQILPSVTIVSIEGERTIAGAPSVKELSIESQLITDPAFKLLSVEIDIHQ